MIKLITDPSELVLDKSYYSGRIEAACKAYGTGYDFCRLYSFDKGSALIYNCSAVISGECDDTAELQSFIMINSPETVECPPHMAERLTLDGYEKRRRTMFERKAVPQTENCPEAASLMKMYEIVKCSFGETELDMWYADMSHRIRHGVSKAYMYKNAACACVDFIYEGAAYISQVAVMPAERGKGFGRKMLETISGELYKTGTVPRLWAYDDVMGFYRSVGFKEIDKDFIYKKEII
ncbi:MAG: GNAT family N-acetyltransferase [Huintestinicola sp.]|uniref:GNAT family N-acetyltransferase n=1 Tax=Huintestinicola sp. TaxID=2981661 RepID=UPI003F00E96E